MWQRLISDVLGCNSKLGPIRAEYSGLIVDELKAISETGRASLRGIIAELHQRRNLTVYSTLTEDQNIAWMKSDMRIWRNEDDEIWWLSVSFHL